MNYTEIHLLDGPFGGRMVRQPACVDVAAHVGLVADNRMSMFGWKPGDLSLITKQSWGDEIEWDEVTGVVYHEGIRKLVSTKQIGGFSRAEVASGIEVYRLHQMNLTRDRLVYRHVKPPRDW
jgi:hypothetical protein